MTQIIMLGAKDQYEALVSDKDFYWLSQWKWQYKISERRYQRTLGTKGVYAKRTTTVDGCKVTLLMSHVILIHRNGLIRPGPDFDADHMNGNSLDYQDDNLQWLHKSINRAGAVRVQYPGAEQFAEAA